MAFGYPIALEVAGRRAVVIGAVAVAMGKVEGLLDAGAHVSVIAEGPPARLDRLARDPRAAIERRGFHPEDLDGAFVCVAYSNDPAERARIALEARARGVLVNVVDDVSNCDFAAPAVVRRGELVIAISTGGASPALARRLRVDLLERFGPEWAEVVELLRDVREATLPALPDIAERSRKWQFALDLDEAAGLVHAGCLEDLRTRLMARLVGSEVPA